MHGVGHAARSSLNSCGRRSLRVDADERVHAAARAAGADGRELAGGGLAEPRGKIRGDDHVVRLGHFAGRLVVLVDRGELVAEVLLQHLLHVGGDEGQPLVDVLGVGPDAAAGEQLLVVVGQVHEGGEVLAEARRGR